MLWQAYSKGNKRNNKTVKNADTTNKFVTFRSVPVSIISHLVKRISH